MEPISQVIAGRYHLVARIGGGGMGEVFRARDAVLGRTVALKILPRSVASSLVSVERFRREAQAAARISHANVVAVHDWGETEGTYYMVMEYLRGRNLRELLADHGTLETRQACQVIDQVLSALSSAHAEGLVHRDIKPENILISTEGIVKVTDFGIAHVREGTSSTGGILGTVAYIAPEQARGDGVDARADIYASGCVMYELLTGAPVFEGDAARVLYQHL
ncbi:MAG: protein kinase, partial [Actinomycetota bacterium]